MLEYLTYFELTTRLMASVNRSGVIALDLFLSLYKTYGKLKQAQMSEHSIYFYLSKKTHGQQQWLKC